MQLHKRLEKLEAKVAPAEFRTVHLVGVMSGQTHDEACARYGPIGVEDDVIFLVGVEPSGRETKQ